jgi:serine/threonine protein kinase
MQMVHRNSDIFNVPLICMDLLLLEPSVVFATGGNAANSTADVILHSLNIKNTALGDLIQRMLEPDPSLRINVAQALVHPAITDEVVVSGGFDILFDIAMAEAKAHAQGFIADIPAAFTYRRRPRDLFRPDQLQSAPSNPSNQHQNTPQPAITGVASKVSGILSAAASTRDPPITAYAGALRDITRLQIASFVKSEGSVDRAAAAFSPHTSRSVRGRTPTFDGTQLQMLIDTSDEDMLIYFEHLLKTNPTLQSLTDENKPPQHFLDKGQGKAARERLRVLQKFLVALQNMDV